MQSDEFYYKYIVRLSPPSDLRTLLSPPKCTFMFTFIQSLPPPLMKVPWTLGLCHFPAYPGSHPMSIHRALPRSFPWWHRLQCVNVPMNIQLLHHTCTLGCFQYFAITTNSGMNNLVHEYFQTYEVDLKDYHLEMGIMGQNVNALVAEKNRPNFPS